MTKAELKRRKSERIRETEAYIESGGWRTCLLTCGRCGKQAVYTYPDMLDVSEIECGGCGETGYLREEEWDD